MILPTSAQSLVGYPVAHFGHLLTFDCSNFINIESMVKDRVKSEGK